MKNDIDAIPDNQLEGKVGERVIDTIAQQEGVALCKIDDSPYWRGYKVFAMTGSFVGFISDWKESRIDLFLSNHGLTRDHIKKTFEGENTVDQFYDFIETP
jgi:hypothetical protein